MACVRKPLTPEYAPPSRTCAHLYAGMQHVAPVEEFSTEKWDKMIAVNLSAAFHTIRLTIPCMREKGIEKVELSFPRYLTYEGLSNRLGKNNQHCLKSWACRVSAQSTLLCY